jgi:polar amino acid transport system substrate-binding protein
MRIRTALAVLPLLALPLAACAPADDEDDSADDPGSSTSTPAAEGTSEPADGETDAASGLSPECADPAALPVLTAGTLTVATDSPAYEPWFVDDDPTNGQGFESAVAYAVAEVLGLPVEWVVVPFNKSYAPGPKDFDFDINQISITPERAEVVDFSDGYYTAAQAIIGLKDSPVAGATSVADLAGYKLGAQTGTTSLTVIRETIQPSEDPAVFEDTNAAKQALLNGQVDGIVADLPTAFYITAVEIPRATILGQFASETDPEEFGMLFEKGNSLVTCVNEALAILEADGTLAGLEEQWLSTEVEIPVLQ